MKSHAYCTEHILDCIRDLAAAHLAMLRCPRASSRITSVRRRERSSPLTRLMERTLLLIDYKLGKATLVLEPILAILELKQFEHVCLLKTR
jgi:hypothetical protein